MMSSDFNRFGWRQLLAITLLLSVLLPLQTVFACEMMGGPAKANCCCDQPNLIDACNSNDCDQATENTLGDIGCCQASFSEGSAVVAATSAQPDIEIGDSVQSQQDPPIITLFNNGFAEGSVLRKPVIGVGYPFAPTQLPTYRLTQRIRL